MTWRTTDWPRDGLSAWNGMNELGAEEGPMQRLESATTGFDSITSWLDRHGVEYEVHEHRRSFTAAETANAEGVDPMTFAKVVGVRTSDGRTALCVLDATDQLLLHELAVELGVEWVMLLDEGELEALAPECEVGTLPPIPEIVGVPVYIDEGVRDDPRISFAAGSHRRSVRIDRVAWEAAAGVGYGRFATRRASWM